MRSYSPRELRNAIILAVLVTALAMVSLLDPSCRSPGESTPTRTLRAALPP